MSIEDDIITQRLYSFLQTWELINTALLTGKQVSQPMKIFVVSQSGKIADVTRQSTCHTEDDSVLKVFTIFMALLLLRENAKAARLFVRIPIMENVIGKIHLLCAQ